MVRGTAIIIAALFHAGPATAHPAVYWAVSHGVTSGRISATQGAAYRLYAALAPERLPAAYRPHRDPSHPVRHSSIELATLKRDFTALPKAVQDEFSWFLARPTLSRVLETEHFKIHYTLSGSDAVTQEFLDSAAAAAEFVWNREVDELGYDVPPVDDMSDPKYDIYLRNMDDAYPSLYYGLTYLENSDGSGYMELDNDYQESGYATRGVTGLQVTLAHEFFHAIQYGYAGFSVTSANAWWMEICSVWMEDVVYDGINDYLQYLEGGSGWFANPHLSLYTYDGWHEYGSCIFNHYLTKKYGTDVVRTIWEQARSAPSALAAVTAGLADAGCEPLADELAEFAAWNVCTAGRADTAAYYPEGHLYPAVHIDPAYATVDAAETASAEFPQVITDVPEGSGAGYAVIENAGALAGSTVVFTGDGDAGWRVRAVYGYSGGGYGVAGVGIGGSGTGYLQLPSSGVATVWLAAVRTEENGSGEYTFAYGSVAAVNDGAGLPDAVVAVSPNPFVPGNDGCLTIGTAVPYERIFVITGADGGVVFRGTVPAGIRYTWDGRNGAGKPVGSGMYAYTIQRSSVPAVTGVIQIIR